MKRVFYCLVICSLLISLSGVGFAQTEETVVWKYSDYRPAIGAGYQLKQWIFEEIDNRSNGRFKFEQYWGGSMGSAKETLSMIGDGVVDAGHLVTLYYPGELPLSYVSWLPFVSNLRIDTTAAACGELFKTNKHIINELASHNVMAGGIHVDDLYNLVSLDPIRKANDFDGKKVRCGAYHGKVLKQFGATVVSIPGPEIYGAMQTGLIDTHLHYVECFYKYGTYEIANYLTRGISMGAATNILGVNMDSWEALPDDLKGIFNSVMELAPEMSRAAFRNPDVYGKQIEAFKEEGIEFIEFPNEERNKLVEAAESVWEEWAEETGQPEVAIEVLEQYNELLDKYSQKYPDGFPDLEGYPYADIKELLR